MIGLVVVYVTTWKPDFVEEECIAVLARNLRWFGLAMKFDPQRGLKYESLTKITFLVNQQLITYLVGPSSSRYC